MSLAYYNEDWKQVSYLNKGPNPGQQNALIIHIDNPVDQEAVVMFEHTPARALPASCKKFNSRYNIYFLKGDQQSYADYQVRPWAVPSGLNSRAQHYPHLKAGKYRIKVIDWQNDKGTPTDFYVHTYGGDKPICMKYSQNGPCIKSSDMHFNVKD